MHVDCLNLRGACLRPACTYEDIRNRLYFQHLTQVIDCSLYVSSAPCCGCKRRRPPRGLPRLACILKGAQIDALIFCSEYRCYHLSRLRKFRT